MNIAVIGAGIAGLTAARILQLAGHEVTVFDKSKGTGGRLSSRSFEGGWIDHGAPYFSSNSNFFGDFLAEQLPVGSQQSWMPSVSGLLRADERLQHIGVPRNSAITRGLVSGQAFQPSTRIGRLVASSAGWQLYNDGGSLLGTWPQVIVAVPAPQALALLKDQPSLATKIAAARMEPCWVAALRTDRELNQLAAVSTFQHPVIRRITCNSAKPGRNNSNVYLVQASKDWSEEHLEETPDSIGLKMQSGFADLLKDAGQSEVLLVHRWRYAFTEKPLGVPYLWDEGLQLGVCGDWCLGRRVEDAWQSGVELASKILAPAAEELA